MKYFTAKFISDVFNPFFLLFPVPYLLVVKVTGDPFYAMKWAIFTSLFFIVTGIFMIYAVKKRIFTDLDVSKREQRPFLFLVLGIIAFTYLSSLFLFSGPVILYATVIGILIGIFIVSIINTRIKASIHVATIAALIFTLSILYGGAFLFLLLLIPIVAWARITLKRHTMTEAIAGASVGTALACIMYIMFGILLRPIF